MKKIKPADLGAFQIDKGLNRLEEPIYEDEPPNEEVPNYNWFDRWIMRKAACLVLNNPSLRYQFGGFTGVLRRAYELIDAEKEQIVHWLLRIVGYVCCIGDIKEITGNVPVVKHETTQPNYRKIVEALMESDEMMPMLVGLDDVLDDIIEKRMKNVSM